MDNGLESPKFPQKITDELNRLAENDQLRALKGSRDLPYDLTSNDYLGLGQSQGQIEGSEPNGSGGSRLLSGDLDLHLELEQFASKYFRAPAALFFNSGYHANLGLLSAIAGRHDTFLYDEKVHASIKEGMRLSPARKWSFPHQDLGALERLLDKCTGTAYVIVEGLYSMDGDLADLPALAKLLEGRDAWLIVDEAHSTGLYGPQGAGLTCHYGLEDKVLARIHTFGKAAAWVGATIVGSRPLIQYLVNKARAFIYTTAFPPVVVGTLHQRLQAMRNADQQREQLRINCELAHQLIFASKVGQQLLQSPPEQGPGLFSPIIPVVIPGNSRVKKIAQELQQMGFDVRPILSPTVPEGQERLRVIVHSHNTPQEIDLFADTLHLHLAALST